MKSSTTGTTKSQGKAGLSSPYPGRRIHFKANEETRKRYDVKLENLIKLQLMKYTRERRIACKTGLHLELNSRGRITATHDVKSPFGALQVISICSDMIALWGKEALAYLAVNEEGEVYAAKNEGRDCVFIERFTQDFFNTYTSYHSAYQNQPRYLSISTSGQVQMTEFKGKIPKEIQFMWLLPGKDVTCEIT